MTKSDDPIQRILRWDGRLESFHEDVAAAVGRVLGTAAAELQAALLYRTWIALIKQRGHLKDGHVHLIWDLLGNHQKGLSRLERWGEHVRPVLTGTLAAVWSTMPAVTNIHPAEEPEWCKAVFAAMRSTVGGDGEIVPDELDACDALVELVWRVFSVDEDVDGTGSVKDMWRTVVMERARALALRAKCRASGSVKPMSVKELISGTGAARAEDAKEQLDAARLVLCFRAYAPESVPEGVEPIDELARRIAEPRAREPEHPLRADASDIAGLIRYLGFEKQSPVAGLLEHCGGYKPYDRPTSSRQVEYVDSLDLNVMLIGQTEVGKSSFLYASECLPIAPEDEDTDPERQMYPKVVLRHVSGHSLDSDRHKWSKLEPTRDTSYKLFAQTKPFGLYSFNIMDSPGEMVGRSGAVEGTPYYDYLPLQIQRLRPRVLALMLDRGGRESKDNSNFETGVNRALSSLKEMLRKESKEEDDERVAAYPVYVIENKADKLIASLRREHDDEPPSAESTVLEEGYRMKLAMEIGQRAFPLGPYFEEAADIEDALRELRNDGGVAQGDPATRDLVIETCEKRKELLGLLRHAGFRNVCLVFVSSKPKEKVEKPSEHVGVEAFWSHLWTDTSELFAEALKRLAQRLLVDELEDAARKIKERGNASHGIGLPPAPRIDKTALHAACKELIAEERVAWSIRQKFDPKVNLWTQMDNLSSGWQKAMVVVKRFEDEVTAFMSDWSAVLRRLIAELNVSPDIVCQDLHPVKLSTDEADWLKDARAQMAGGAAEADSPVAPGDAEVTFENIIQRAQRAKAAREAQEVDGGEVGIPPDMGGKPAGKDPSDDTGLLRGGRFSVSDVVRLALAMRGVDREQVDDLIKNIESKLTDEKGASPITLGPLIVSALETGGAPKERVSEVKDGINAVLQSRQNLKYDKRLAKSDVHGFFGSLRHSALLRENFETAAEPKGAAGTAFEWLKMEPTKSLFERVESDIGSDDDKNKTIEDALWLVSDWGIDAGEKAPNYRPLAVRRYERNRFLLRSHLKANEKSSNRSPADRIERVIALVQKLGKIRDILKTGNGVQKKFGSAVKSFALSVVLQTLQFDVEKIIGSEEELTQVENVLRELNIRWVRHYIPIWGPEKYLPVLQEQEANLSKFRISTGGSILPTDGRPSVCRAAYNIAAFARQAVGAVENADYLTSTKDGADGVEAAINAELQELQKKVDEYNRDMMSYLEMTLRLFLDIHYEYVLRTGLLERVGRHDRETREILADIVGQPFRDIAAGMERGSDQKLERQVERIDEFVEKVKKLIEKQAS